MEILLIISAIILFGYIIYVSIKFPNLKSLSQSYYELKDKGWLFQVALILTAFTLVPYWIDLSEGSPFQFLSFLASGALMFVAASPNFMDKYEGKIHEVSALTSAICSIAWVLFVGSGAVKLLIVSTFLIVISNVRKSFKDNYIFVLELIAFITTYWTIAKY